MIYVFSEYPIKGSRNNENTRKLYKHEKAPERWL